MTSTDARDIAVDTLAATKAVIDHLDGLHSDLHAERDGRGYVAVETVLARKVGECRDTIRFGLKFAEINALVAISDRLTELVVLASEKPTVIVINSEQPDEIAELVSQYAQRARASL